MCELCDTWLRLRAKATACTPSLPIADLAMGNRVMIHGLGKRTDLNGLAAVVTHPLVVECEVARPRATAAPSPQLRFNSRVGVRVCNIAEESVCIKLENVLRVDKNGCATLPTGEQVLPTAHVAAVDVSTKPA